MGTLCIDSTEEMLSKVFLKGYQWPFDVRKVDGGSSIIDILVYIELSRGRRVFLDFRSDPAGGKFDFQKLSDEARTYLERAGALVALPIERLKIMNQPAIDFYRDKGVDIEREMLEISLCAQHNNGGIDINSYWQSGVEGLFVVGEAAGSHGVYRPGGSALNAGQVGSTRAALYIANRRGDAEADDEMFRALSAQAVDEADSIAKSVSGDTSNVMRIKDEVSSLMSLYAGAIRSSEAIEEACCRIDRLYTGFAGTVRINTVSQLRWVFRLRDMLISIKSYMFAMTDYAARGGKSRGSALYTDYSGRKPYPELPDIFTFTVDDGRLDEEIQTVRFADGKCGAEWRGRRPLPECDDFFEVVWKSYRENKNI